MRATRVVLFSLCLSLCVSCASSDSDPDSGPAPEEQKAAPQADVNPSKQMQEAQAERNIAEASAKQHAALIHDKRRWLGSAATGKSDGDVERLYEQKMHIETDAAASSVDTAQRAMRDRRANEQMKAATGKSMQEIVSMSPEEQQEWAAEMEGSDGC